MTTKGGDKGKGGTDKQKTARVHAQRAVFVDLLCAATMETDKGIKRICDAARKDNPEFPAARTIRDWLKEDEGFNAQYTRAKEQQIEHIADQILEIADDDSEDELFVGGDDETGASAKRVQNSEFIARSRLRVDSRKWLLSKLNPKKYGDKVTMAGDSDNPLVVSHKHELTEEELIAIAAGSRHRATS